MSVIKNEITIGSLLSIGTILISMAVSGVALARWGGQLEQRMIEAERRTISNSEALSILGREVNRLDGNNIRVDEKLNSVLAAIADLRQALSIGTRDE